MSRIDHSITHSSQSLNTQLTGVPVKQRKATPQRDGKMVTKGDLKGKAGSRAIISAPVTLPDHTPPAPVQDGIDIGYGILEDETRFGVSVQYYDEAKNEWVTVGAKDHGKGKPVTSDTGTQDGGTLFVPYQNGKPPKIRINNTSEDVSSVGTGRVQPDGTVIYTWETRGKSTNDLVPDVGYFPSTNEANGKDGKRIVQWHDGGGGVGNGKTRNNVTLYYKHTTQPGGTYSPLTTKISEDTANATLYAANGAKPLTKEDMAAYVEMGIVKINPNGSWCLDPSMMTEKDMKTIVLNILGDPTLTLAQKNKLLDSIGVDAKARTMIDAKFGNNDGKLTGTDITKATAIDPKTGKSKPYEVNFAHQKGKDGEFIQIEPGDGRTAAVIPTKAPNGVVDADYAKYAHDRAEGKYDGTNFKTEADKAKAGEPSILTDIEQYISDESAKLEEGATEVYNAYHEQMQEWADPKHPDHDKYVKIKEDIAKAEKANGGKRISVVTIGAIFEAHAPGINRIPHIKAFFDTIKKIETYIAEKVGTPMNGVPTIVVSPRVFFNAADLVDPKPSDPKVTVVFRVGVQDTIGGQYDRGNLGAGGLAEAGFEISVTFGIKDPKGQKMRQIAISAEVEGGLWGNVSGGHYFPEHGGKSADGFLFIKGEVKLVWLRDKSGKMDAKPDEFVISGVASVGVEGFASNDNPFAGGTQVSPPLGAAAPPQGGIYKGFVPISYTNGYSTSTPLTDAGREKAKTPEKRPVVPT
jgi:hypothetical protein